MGAIAAGANRDTVNRLFWYGYFVGMSYQIIDDILDFVSTEEKLGKPAGGDLLQREYYTSCFICDGRSRTSSENHICT